MTHQRFSYYARSQLLSLHNFQYLFFKVILNRWYVLGFACEQPWCSNKMSRFTLHNNNLKRKCQLHFSLKYMPIFIMHFIFYQFIWHRYFELHSKRCNYKSHWKFHDSCHWIGGHGKSLDFFTLIISSLITICLWITKKII